MALVMVLVGCATYRARHGGHPTLESLLRSNSVIPAEENGWAVQEMPQPGATQRLRYACLIQPLARLRATSKFGWRN